MCSRLPFWNCSFKQRLILEITYVTAASNVLVVQTSFVAEREIIIFFSQSVQREINKEPLISPAASTWKLITARSKNIAETPSIPSEMFHSNILLFSQTFPQEKDMLLDAAMTGVQWSSSKSQLILINSSTSCCADPDPNFRNTLFLLLLKIFRADTQSRR